MVGACRRCSNCISILDLTPGSIILDNDNWIWRAFYQRFHVFLPHYNYHDYYLSVTLSLQWHHNGRDSLSNHQPHHCLPKYLFRRRSKKTWKLRVTGLCAGNSPGTGEFPAQMASNAKNVSIWWRHHGDETFQLYWNVDCRRGYPLDGISCLISLWNHMGKVIYSKYDWKGRCGDYFHLS